MPAKNPYDTAPPDILAYLRIEVEHANGVEVFDPNSLIGCLLNTPERIRSLTPLPGRASEISGAPAMLFRTSEIEVAVTPEECLRLAGHELRPEEYLALRKRRGLAHEWHYDFYDADTGEAMQPLHDRRSTPAPG